MAFLDIIIPEYNCKEEYIKRLLNSIHKPKLIDLSEIRILIINDGSEYKLDNNIFNKYFRLDIKYIIKDKNEGQGLARQYGLDLSDAEYVTFIDQDDLIFSPENLSRVINILKKNRMDMLFTDYVRWDIKNDIKELVTYETLACLHGVFYKREALVNGGFRFNPRIWMYEDTYFVRITHKLLKPKYFKIPTYIWVNNEDSQTNIGNIGTQMIQKRFNEFMIANIDSAKFIKSHGSMDNESYVNILYDLFIIVESDLFTDSTIYESDIYDYYLYIKDEYNSINNDRRKELYSESLMRNKNSYGIKEVKLDFKTFIKRMEK